VVIDEGRLIHDGTVDEVVARYTTTRTLVVDLEHAQPPVVIPGVEVVRVDGPRQWLRFRRDETTAAAVLAAVAQAADVRDLTLEEPDIEDVVKLIYRGERGG
jgi:ABC-2 type transport system ATP-binding protein